MTDKRRNNEDKEMIHTFILHLWLNGKKYIWQIIFLDRYNIYNSNKIIHIKYKEVEVKNK